MILGLGGSQEFFNAVRDLEPGVSFVDPAENSFDIKAARYQNPEKVYVGSGWPEIIKYYQDLGIPVEVIGQARKRGRAPRPKVDESMPELGISERDPEAN